MYCIVYFECFYWVYGNCEVVVEILVVSLVYYMLSCLFDVFVYK